MMGTLPYTLDRTVIIHAAPAIVFRHFIDCTRWAAWWGAGSSIDPRPGGRVYVRYPDGSEASGEVVEIDPPHRIVFTYGYASGKPFPSGASRVTISLEPHPEGTRLTLAHELPDEASREDHVQGWRYQLSLFANVAADDANGTALKAVDDWFAAWALTNADERRRVLLGIASEAVQLHDRFSCIDGVDDLVPHIGAAQRFMPGITLNRQGDVRHCQGTVLANWAANGPDGQPRGAGVNVFVIGADGRFSSVTGFWG